MFELHKRRTGVVTLWTNPRFEKLMPTFTVLLKASKQIQQKVYICFEFILMRICNKNEYTEIKASIIS